MAEIVETRKKTKTGIGDVIKEFSGTTRWGSKPNEAIIKLGTEFCQELLDYADKLDNMDTVHRLGLFANTVLALVAGTRCYDTISKEEFEAFNGIFEVLKLLRAEMILGTDFNDIFDRLMYIREIFMTNTAKREDFDCKERQFMIFPSYIDVYEIVTMIINNWEKLCESDDFSMLFINFRNDWYKAETDCDYYSDDILDSTKKSTDVESEEEKQEKNPDYTRMFKEMLRTRIGK